jgi:hypothetical protein
VFDPVAYDKHSGRPQASAGLMTAAGSLGAFRLPRGAKLADKPCRNRWQLQRINLIAFQAPKRARRFTVIRHHQHHQAVAVLASPGWIGLTHALI